jgi:hypothetical protein
MIGVIAGILLTDYWQGRQDQHKRAFVIESIDKEIEDNKQYAIQFRDTLSYQLEPFATVIRAKNGDSLRIHMDSLQSFIDQTAPVFTLAKTAPAANDSLILKGELNLNLNMESMLLFIGFRDVVWSAYRTGKHVNNTEFECLVSLENLYSFQHECSQAFRSVMAQLVAFLRVMPTE